MIIRQRENHQLTIDVVWWIVATGSGTQVFQIMDSFYESIEPAILLGIRPCIAF